MVGASTRDEADARRVANALTMRAVSVDHYENFPVASILCPPALRAPIAAIYWYARTADDIADEGDAAPATRLADLSAYRQHLQAAARGPAHVIAGQWEPVFRPLAAAIERHRLPVDLLEDLLSAFEQDVHPPVYEQRAELLDYCRRSANPVGRLLLHLNGVTDAASLARSDAICSALQLANFWQDLGVDASRGRVYLPGTDLTRHGATRDGLLRREDSPALRAAVRTVTGWARELMLFGAPLVHALPGRAGWELRLVVQGGLRILDKVDRLQGATVTTRPRLHALDVPLLLWRALRMQRTASPITTEAA